MSELTHEELTRLLDYDPETGVFRWKVYRGPRAKAGDVAGCKGEKGWMIRILGGSYFSRRLAYFFVTKKMPDGSLFVKNGDKYDDRIENIGLKPKELKELTQELLMSRINYNPSEGTFQWRTSYARSVIGENAFCIKNDGGNSLSLQTKLFGQKYMTLHLVVMYMTGYMPSKDRVVITVDNNVLNLKWDNIKVTNFSSAMVRRRNFGKSPLKGVYFSGGKKKPYTAAIRINGKQIRLGTFPTEAEAHAAYMKAARKHYGALANDGYQHAMYEMEYEEVVRPVEPVPVPEPEPVVEEKIEPVIQHSDDF